MKMNFPKNLSELKCNDLSDHYKITLIKTSINLVCIYKEKENKNQKKIL